MLHPHPEGAYRELFEAAASGNHIVKYYGDRFAKISPLSNIKNGVFTGKLATWTEIDPGSNLIEKSTLNEVLFSDSDVTLPDGVGFNSKVFSFAFRIADHRLYIETRNDENENISIKLAKTAFKRIFELSLGPIAESVDVHVVSSENALDLVLSTPGLRFIEIQVDLPNPDVLTGSKREIIESMQLMKAKRFRIELTKQAGEDHLVLSEGVRAVAELGQENGFVTALGRENGDTVERSTKQFPMEIETILNVDESRAAATRRIAEVSQEGL